MKPKADPRQPDLPSSVSIDPRVTDLEEALVSLVNGDELEQRHAGALIGKYRIQRILGCHGQAVVVQAYDPDLDRDVALKIYHAAVSGRHRSRMLNEGRALARIQGPQVADCYGVEEYEDCIFLVIEYVEGETLREYLDRETPSRDRMLEIACDIARGLEQVHNVGLLHRDLKPANIVLPSSGGLKIIDFGLVGPLDSKEIPDSDSSGTPAYMAPERARRQIELIDHRSDIFSAGSILYEMLNGEAPFASDSNAASRELAAAGRIEPLRSSEPLSRLTMRCLSENIDRRPRTAGALADMLVALKTRSSGRRRNLNRIVGIVFACIVALSVGWFLNVDLESRKKVDLAVQTVKDKSTLALAHCRYGEFDKARSVVSEARTLASQPELGEFLSTDTSQLAAEIEQTEEFNPTQRREYSQSLVALDDGRHVLSDQVGNKDKILTVLEAVREAAEFSHATFGSDSMHAFNADMVKVHLEMGSGVGALPEFAVDIANRRADAAGKKSRSYHRAALRAMRSRLATGNNAGAIALADDCLSIDSPTDLASARLALRFIEMKFMVQLVTPPINVVELDRITEEFRAYRDAAALSEDDVEIANVDYMRCLTCRHKKNFEECIRSGQNAINIFGSQPNLPDREKKLVYLYQYLACAHANLGDRGSAEETIEEAFQIVRAKKSSELMQVLNEAAGMAKVLGDFQKSYDYLVEANSIGEAAFAGTRTATILESNVLGTAISLAKSSGSEKPALLRKLCLPHFKAALEKADQIPEGTSDFVMFNILSNGALIYLELDEESKANELIQQLASICEAHRDDANWKKSIQDYERLVSRIGN